MRPESHLSSQAKAPATLSFCFTGSVGVRVRTEACKPYRELSQGGHWMHFVNPRHPAFSVHVLQVASVGPWKIVSSKWKLQITKQNKNTLWLFKRNICSHQK